MQDALGEEERWGNLSVDFYNANHIASWTREFPSSVLWMKKRMGTPMLGWYPYLNWSGSAEDAEFIIDKKISIRHGSNEFDGVNNTRQAIEYLRNNLRHVSRSVRLVTIRCRERQD